MDHKRKKKSSRSLAVVSVPHRKLPSSFQHLTANVPHPKEDNFLNLSLRCIYTNCDSIVNKVNEFELLLSSSNPHVIILTETKLHSEILRQEVFPLFNYTVFRRYRDSANVGGGVCILVRNDISCVSVNSV